MGPRIREATDDDAPIPAPTIAEQIRAMGERAIAEGALVATLTYETARGFGIKAAPDTESVRKGLSSMAIDHLYPDAEE
jgi:hypothetical protein